MRLQHCSLLCTMNSCVHAPLSWKQSNFASLLGQTQVSEHLNWPLAKNFHEQKWTMVGWCDQLTWAQEIWLGAVDCEGWGLVRRLAGSYIEGWGLERRLAGSYRTNRHTHFLLRRKKYSWGSKVWRSEIYHQQPVVIVIMPSPHLSRPSLSPYPPSSAFPHLSLTSHSPLTHAYNHMTCLWTYSKFVTEDSAQYKTMSSMSESPDIILVHLPTTSELLAPIVAPSVEVEPAWERDYMQ